MKHVISALAFLSMAVLSAGTPAQTYQWKDGSGRTVISDTPPPGNVRGTRSLESAEPPAPPRSAAEKDMEFRKRQQEAREKADKESRAQAAAAAKQENCERARRQLAVLESQQPLASFDENGQRRLMQTAERQNEIERARAIMADSCK